MASAAENLTIVDRYLSTKGDLGPVDNMSSGVERAMRQLMIDASWDSSARRMFASHSVFERTLNPPSIMVTTFVRPAVQRAMLERLYEVATGGFWSPPRPAGITEWLGSEAGGRYYFFARLNDPPRVLESSAGDLSLDVEIPLDPEVLSLLLKIVRDVALPAAWFAPFLEHNVFGKLEAQIASGEYDAGERRSLLALVSQAKARVQRELAGSLSPANLGALQTFQAGDQAAVPTVPPPPKRWYRNGWLWLSGGLGLVGGAIARK